jgi:hypothetical protein
MKAEGGEGSEVAEGEEGQVGDEDGLKTVEEENNSGKAVRMKVV